MKHLTSLLVGIWVVLFASLAFPCAACAQNQHAGFFNGGTTLTATCTNTSGALVSSDFFLGTLQGNTTVTLPAAAIGCVDRDVIDLRATQGTSSSFTLTVNGGTGTVTKVLSNGGTLIAVPTAGAVTSVVLHQIWVYNSVAATPQWELVTQETQPAATNACATMPALTGDTTSSAGSCATTTVQVNGAAVPTSAKLVSSNASNQLVAAAASTFPIAVSATGAISTQSSTTILASTTFTTSASVPTYKVIVIGGAGGGGSSTGAGTGGAGGSPAFTTCEVQGAGTAYTVTVGAGGAKGAAGANGSDGVASSVTAGGASSACQSNPGLHGVAGTASAGAGGTGGAATTLGEIFNFGGLTAVGVSVSSFLGAAGTNGSTLGGGGYYGIIGGNGCAGSNCTTDTAGGNGEVIFIPEP